MSTLLLVRLGEEHGVPAEVTLRGTGLHLEDLAEPAMEVSAHQELAVITHLVDAVDDSVGLGLEAGARYHLTAYGLWGFMLLSSPTPRSAMDLALRYIDLTFAFARVEAHERDDEVQVVIDAEDLPARVRRFVVERDSAAIRTLVKEAFSPTFGPRRETWHGDVATLSFDAAALDHPMPQADAHAAAVALDQCRAALQRRRARSGTSGQVRDLLVDRLADPPGAEAAAAALGIGVRTLQRRLVEEGTTFRALLDEVREQLAEELLVSAGLTVTEVAGRLGYAEVSSFSQAFRRWKGVGPRAFVRRARGPRSSSRRRPGAW